MKRLSLTLSVLAAVLAIQFGKPAYAGDGGQFAKRLSAAEISAGGLQVQSPGQATEPGDAAPMDCPCRGGDQTARSSAQGGSTEGQTGRALAGH